jgi:hypothetical protein
VRRIQVPCRGPLADLYTRHEVVLFVRTRNPPSKNPAFPLLVAEAVARRKLARKLAAVREGKALPHI